MSEKLKPCSICGHPKRLKNKSMSEIECWAEIWGSWRIDQVDHYNYAKRYANAVYTVAVRTKLRKARTILYKAAAIILLPIILSGCTDPVFAETGIASYYTNVETHHKKCADGRYHDLSREFCCASWEYPFKTRLKISSMDTGRTIICVVVDRGPNRRLKRIIDLSICSFKALSNESFNQGLLEVKVEKI